MSTLSQLAARSELPRSLMEILTEASQALEAFNASGEESVRILHMCFVAAALTRYSGNKCRAARRLGIHRNTLYRQIEELQLQTFVDQLVKKGDPQLGLFHKAVRRGPARAGFAQDTLVLNRNSQGRNGTYPQLTNRVTLRSS